MTFFIKRTFGVLGVLLVFPLLCAASECFQGIQLGEKTVFRVAGVNYSNCFVEVVQDSIGLWVGSVDLGSSGPDNHQGMRETVSDLENHPYCSALRDSGMAGVAAIKETIRVKSQVERSIKNALADIDSRQAFDFETTKLEKDSLVSNFGVELMWESRLNQAFFKFSQVRIGSLSNLGS